MKNINDFKIGIEVFVDKKQPCIVVGYYPELERVILKYKYFENKISRHFSEISLEFNGK